MLVNETRTSILQLSSASYESTLTAEMLMILLLAV
jgi:hypothetical protein